jgi:biotin carboxyl carrier protein
MSVQLKPDDVLPPMREDLVVTGNPHPANNQLIAVRDPISNRTVSFRGFELSLARLLDGRRTAVEVMHAARTLGMPISLASLQNFTAKLSAIGFLQTPGAAAPKNKTTWKPRPLWSPELREQFRTALKDAREDRLDQARGYLEQVLKADPTVKDAIELVAWIDKRKKTITTLAGMGMTAPSANPLLTTPLERTDEDDKTLIDPNFKVSAPPPPRPPAPPPLPPSEPEPETLGAAPLPVAASPPPLAKPAAKEKPVDILAAPEAPGPTRSFGEVFADADQGWYADIAEIEETLTRVRMKKGSGWGLRAVAVLLAAAAGAAVVVPIPRTVTARFTLAPEDDVAITAPQSGTVTKLTVSEGKWVEAEDELLQLSASDRAGQLAELEKRIAELEQKAAAAKPQAKGKRGPSSQGELADDVQRFLKKAKAERQALLQRSESAKVTALTSGFVRELAVKVGDPIEADAPLCRIVASKHLVAKIDVPYGAPVASGQRATLHVNGRKLDVTLENANKATAEATLNNEDGALPVGGRGEAVIHLGARSFLQL